ncbi:hypothetical protein DYB37_002913 [Aphanomyces astaci]|uniref:Fungal lipase-type domain-containing protein n=2 Tax=Aphanomyces astaci TaxID=112090 RepID=A0A3R7AF56_APHAT|nr:hypothetical protein DYB37_002913 [Aphanomyces astaci]
MVVWNRNFKNGTRMLRHAAAVRRRLTQTLASPQPLQRDPLSILKTIADAVPSSLMKMTSADWLLRLTVMARHNSSRPPSTTQSRLTLRGALQSSTKLEESAFLKELQYYVRVCDAVYASTQERFMKDSLLADSNVTIVQSHQGGVFAPKYYVYVDHDIQTIVLVIRGSASIQDFVTDMCMHHEPFQTGYGHRGIVHAANWMDWKLRDDMIKLAATHPTYDVRLTGHSLGAGAAALLAHLWSPVVPRMHCLVFAPPACLTLDLAQTCRGHVTSVILGDDCVPRLNGFAELMSLWGKLDVNVVAIEGLLRFVNDPERKRQLVGQIEGLLREISTTRSMFTNYKHSFRSREPKPTASSPVLQNKILSMVDGICAELRREIDSILELGKSSVYV